MKIYYSDIKYHIILNTIFSIVLHSQIYEETFAKTILINGIYDY